MRDAAATGVSRRLLVLAASLPLLWGVWFYCANEAGTALFKVAAAVCAVALAPGRPLALSSRRVIWLSLGVTVLCMAANLERLAPARSGYMHIYLLDRAVTALFAASGLSALFFAINRTGITRIWCGALPMAMLTAGRLAWRADNGAAAAKYLMPVMFLLLGTLELARQGWVQRISARVGFSGREGARRSLWLLGWMALSVAVAPQVGVVAKEVQNQVRRWAFRSYRTHSWLKGSDMILSAGLPANFRARNRLLLTLRGSRTPGYLRENVYASYEHGRWRRTDTGSVMQPDGIATGETARGWALYSLGGLGAVDGSMGEVRVEVMAPRRVRALCLPGSASALACEAGAELLRSADGIITPENMPVLRYSYEQGADSAGATAYQLPRDGGEDDYLAVPKSLAGMATDWVADCAGLAEAETARAAGRAIARDFAGRYTYRDDIRVNAYPDPMVNFMRDRVGFCIHFASAAAIMLRARGFPARVVGGYLSGDYAPWLKSWTVRESNGHAWVEVWDVAERRWLLVEATPGDGLPTEAVAGVGFLRRMSDMLALLRRQLMNFAQDANPLQFLADAGETVFVWTRAVFWNWRGALSALLALGAIAWLRMRDNSSEEERVRRRFAEAARDLSGRFSDRGGRRRAWESWDSWLERMETRLAPDEHRALAELLESYQSIRYNPVFDRESALAWIERARIHRA